jgi:hypothetical protein
MIGFRNGVQYSNHEKTKLAIDRMRMKVQQS